MNIVNLISEQFATFNYIFNGLHFPKDNLAGGTMCIEYDKDTHNKGTIIFKLKKNELDKELSNRSSLSNEEMSVIQSNWKSITVDKRIEFQSIMFEKTMIVFKFTFSF